jgi:nucleoside-diphosphate-sugar epimerase
MISILGANGVLARALSRQMAMEQISPNKVTRMGGGDSQSFLDFLENLKRSDTEQLVVHLAGSTRLDEQNDLRAMINANLFTTMKLLEVADVTEKINVISIGSASSAEFDMKSPKLNYQLSKFLENRLIKESPSFDSGRWLVVVSPLLIGQNLNSEILNSITKCIASKAPFVPRNPSKILKFVDEESFAKEIVDLSKSRIDWPKQKEYRLTHWESSIADFSNNCTEFMKEDIDLNAKENIYLSNTTVAKGSNPDVILNPKRQIDAILQNITEIRKIYTEQQ